MLYYTIGQWRVFVFMLLAGAAAGAWYGLILRAGRLMQAGPWLNAFLDLLCALGIWLVLTAALLIANYGQVRAYALIAFALGLAIERLTVGRLIMLLLNGLGLGLKKALEAITSCHLMKKIFR